MKNLFEMELESDTKSLEVVADFIEKILKEKKIKYRIIEEILVAIDEAVTNIIEHSYKGQKGKYIKVLLKVTLDKIIVSIFDKGPAFEPKKIPSPTFSKDMDKLTPGGLGLFLMKKFMDEVTFYFKGNCREKNEVKMVKYLI